MAPPRGNRCRHCQPWAGSIAGHADRAVTPRLPAAGGKLPAAFRGFEAEAAGQGQAQRQPSGRYLQACAAPTGVDEVQGLTGVWLELAGLRERQGEIGIASVRERVWSYVEVADVVVDL